MRAAKLGKRAAGVGFDWPDAAGVRDKVDEELSELDEAMRGKDLEAISEEFGDLLFALGNLGRHLQVDAETALLAASTKFERRFKRMETMAAAQSRSVGSLDSIEWDALWNRAKSAGGPDGQ